MKLIKKSHIVAILLVSLFITNAQPALALSKFDRSALLKGAEMFDPRDGCDDADLSAATGGDAECLGAKYPNVNDPAAFAKAIDDYIKKNSSGSYLNGLGSIFVSAGSEFGVNPAYMVAIAQKESSFGTTGIATKGTNNPFGNSCDPGGRSWRNNPVKVTCKNIPVSGGPSQWNSYNSPQEGIRWVAFYIKDAFFSEGKTTLAAIGETYCHNCGQQYVDAIKKYIENIIKLAGPAVTCGASAPIQVTTSTGTTQAKAGAVYIVGDSIANRAKQTIESQLNTNGWSVNINAVDGRPLNGPITTVPANAGKPNGVAAIEADKENVKNAVAIVVELGTNPGDQADFGAQINSTVDKLRTINQTAPIYWINIGSSGNTVGPQDTNALKSVQMFNARNKAIGSNSTLKNYSVINWAGSVFPNVDPSALSPNQDSSSGLLDTDHVHPNQLGVKAFADLITDSVTGGSLANSSGNSAGCENAQLGTPNAGTEGGFDIGPGKLTYYNQGDKTWANHQYGNSASDTMQRCGCGPTAMAMIIATLKGDTSITPVTVADYISSTESKYISGGCGSYDTIGAVATHWGLKAKTLGKDMNAAIATLRSGGLVLLNIKQGGPVKLSPTASGHFVVLRKVDSTGQIVYVANPGSRGDNEIGFKVSDVVGQLQTGPNPLWAITR